MFVGAAAQFKEKLTETVHYISAAICVSAAIIWILLVGYWYIPVVFFVVAGAIIYRYKKPIFWIEVAALTSTYLTLTIY